MDIQSKLAGHLNAIPRSGIRDFFELVIGRNDVISLGVGEPDFSTPWSIREAAIYSLEKGETSYTSNLRMLSLREKITEYVDEFFHSSYRPDSEVLVTVGVSEALDLALRALLNPGDEVIYHEPCYVSYSPSIVMAHGVAVPVATTQEDGFSLKPAALAAAITPRTKIVMLNFPTNPTGAVATQEDLEGITKLCIEHDLIVLSDEIYSEHGGGLPLARGGLLRLPEHSEIRAHESGVCNGSAGGGAGSGGPGRCLRPERRGLPALLLRHRNEGFEGSNVRNGAVSENSVKKGPMIEQLKIWRENRNYAYVVPFAAFMIFNLIYQFVGEAMLWEHDHAPWYRHWPEQLFYPIQTILCGLVLAFFWKHYEFRWTSKVWIGVFAGFVGIAFWLLPTVLYDHFGMTGMRFLLDMDGDYWKVPFGKPALISFIVVTLAFMLAHAPLDWAGALIYGSITYWVAVKTKSLLACVVMHAVANTSMAAFAMVYGKYGLW